MAECPLPKPNTRVRFPSSAPNEKTAIKAVFSFGAVDGRENPSSSRNPTMPCSPASFGLFTRRMRRVWVQIPVVGSAAFVAVFSFGAVDGRERQESENSTQGRDDMIKLNILTIASCVILYYNRLTR